MHLPLNLYIQKLQTLHRHRSNDVEGTEQHFVRPLIKRQGQAQGPIVKKSLSLLKFVANTHSAGTKHNKPSGILRYRDNVRE